MLMRLFLSCCLSIAVLQPCAAQTDGSSLIRSREFIEEQARLQAIIVEIESDSGPYNPALLEPLDSLVELQINAGDFEAVESIQNRQLQLMRAERGLDHYDNILLVRSIIENQIRLGKWVEVSDNLEHIRYLQSVNRDLDEEGLVDAIRDQAQWHLLRVYLDEARLRARNLLRYREYHEEVEDILEQQYGDDSLEMVPVLYQQALSLFHVVSALNSENSLSGDMLDGVIRKDGIGKLQLHNPRFQSSVNGLFGPNSFVPVVDGDGIIGESYLRDALSKIDDIRDILEINDEAEALAMANLYYGDFQLLLNRGTGRRSYRKSREMLIESGIPESVVEAYFSQPQIIPQSQFYFKLEQAQAAAELRRETPFDANAVHLGRFVALEQAAPGVEMPALAASQGIPMPEHVVLMSFTINTRGDVSSVKTIDAESEESTVRRRAVRAVRQLRFRPSIIEGKNKRVRGALLNYQFSKSRTR